MSIQSWYWKQLCKVKDRFGAGYSLDRWSFDIKGYTASSGYYWLRGEQQQVQWASWVWNRLNIPKCSFIVWMAMWRRLQTKDRLVRFGMCEDDTCPVCGTSAETIDHIFFTCPYSQICVQELGRALHLPLLFNDLDAACRQIPKLSAGRFKNQVFQSCVVAMMYCIWRQRNEAVWNKTIKHPRALVRQVKHMCFWRITSIMPQRIKSHEREWFVRLLS
ncbi:uncharacterized protein [Spinacia oleracea]|uniref:Reverse transcriptase zinc-binding domain-containing protein n=1 Tax=Spinacia oleracea TaxID=3562 RepID=A0A9R0IDJ3_SPIOL|nr:uncharacterized protein LOC110785971 [Spinacia oleracea]